MKFMSSSTTSKGSLRKAAASLCGSRSVTIRRNSFLSTSSAVSARRIVVDDQNTPGMLPLFMFRIEHDTVSKWNTRVEPRARDSV